MPGIRPKNPPRKEPPKPKKIRMGPSYSVDQEEYERIMRAEKLRCPRCGGRVLPRGPQDKLFYGCSRWPRCQGTLPWSATESVV